MVKSVHKNVIYQHVEKYCRTRCALCIASIAILPGNLRWISYLMRLNIVKNILKKKEVFYQSIIIIGVIFLETSNVILIRFF